MPESSPTLAVYWPEKFGQRIVVISAEAFDAATHRLASDGPPASPAAEAAESSAGDAGGAESGRRRRGRAD